MDEDNQGGALNTAMDGTEDALGGLDFASIRAKQAAYKTAADDKKAFYDRMEKELLARRMGPTLSEKLLQMSAALLQPTTTRGFGASLANLMPVLQQQSQQRREGEISRADALQKLQLAQLAGRQDLAGKELDTQVALARISAAQNKPKNPYAGAVWDADAKQWVMRPGAEGGPPTLTLEQVAELSKDPKNRGLKFYTTDGRPMEIK